ncbi:hypothetical protein TREES_T100006309 [Tupaia chinensis]|uniref:Uncharacterized protein n=1 Tax=Tupaia chinensis TaxID=246437 RepID=L9L314_TUPCH|nr:hypothetical protein TREES_T100006309 [Tupaia chinensis]
MSLQLFSITPKTLYLLSTVARSVAKSLCQLSTIAGLVSKSLCQLSTVAGSVSKILCQLSTVAGSVSKHLLHLSVVALKVFKSLLQLSAAAGSVSKSLLQVSAAAGSVSKNLQFSAAAGSVSKSLLQVSAAAGSVSKNLQFSAAAGSVSKSLLQVSAAVGSVSKSLKFSAAAGSQKYSRLSLLSINWWLLHEAKKISRQVSLVLNLSSLVLIGLISLGQPWIHFQVPLTSSWDPAGFQTIPITTILFVRCPDISCMHEYDQNAWTSIVLSILFYLLQAHEYLQEGMTYQLGRSFYLAWTGVFLFLMTGTSIVLSILFYLLQAHEYLQEGMTYQLGRSFYLAWTGVFLFLMTGLLSYLNYMNFWSIWLTSDKACLLVEEYSSRNRRYSPPQRQSGISDTGACSGRLAAEPAPGRRGPWSGAHYKVRRAAAPARLAAVGVRVSECVLSPLAFSLRRRFGMAQGVSGDARGRAGTVKSPWTESAFAGAGQATLAKLRVLHRDGGGFFRRRCPAAERARSVRRPAVVWAAPFLLRTSHVFAILPVAGRRQRVCQRVPSEVFRFGPGSSSSVQPPTPPPAPREPSDNRCALGAEQATRSGVPGMVPSGPSRFLPSSGSYSACTAPWPLWIVMQSPDELMVTSRASPVSELPGAALAVRLTRDAIEYHSEALRGSCRGPFPPHR